MPQQFANLVDLKRIEALLQSFYELTAIPSAIADSGGTVLVGVGWCKMCTEFHRKHPETAARCAESDRLLSQMAGQEMGIVCRRCLNGLIDVAVPVVIRGEHVASLYMGQFVPQFVDRDFFVQQAGRYGFDKQAYLDAFDELLPFDRERTSKEIGFLSQLAGLVGEMGLDQMKLREFNAELERTVETRTVQLRKEIDVRRRAEEATRKTLSEFETIFNNSSVGIFYIKGDRSIHRTNRRFAEMLGYAPEELAGKNTRFLHADAAAYETAGKVYAVMEGNTDFVQREYQFQRKNGELFWCSVYGKAVDPANIGDGVIWVAVDITEHKDFERLREDVDVIMRHDLKVPVNGIIGLSKSLLGEPNLTAEQNELLELVIEAGYMISNQINQSLEIFKLETGRYVFLPVPVDIEALIKRVVRDLQSKAEEKEISIGLCVEESLAKGSGHCCIPADEMLSYTLFSNLVDNAVDATPPGKEVSIRLGLNDHRCCIVVHNPSEVPPEIRSVFFDKYVTSGKSYGTGLGTYCAKRMAEAQQGDIRMESSAEEGTTIRVCLPLS